MGEKIKKVNCGLRELLSVFSSFKNVFLFFIFTTLFWLLLVALPNTSVVGTVLSGPRNSVVNFLDVIIHSFAGFLPFSQVSTVLISVLFGLNLVLFINLRKNSKKLKKKTTGTIAGGLLFGILGAGCGACGILAVSFLSFFGLGSLVALLPMGGVEFEIAGIVLLGTSLILISSRLIHKNNCKIKS